MRYEVKRKFRKLWKWLDDKWLKRNIIPETDHRRLVLPNGMVLLSPVGSAGRAAVVRHLFAGREDPVDRAARYDRARNREGPPPPERLFRNPEELRSREERRARREKRRLAFSKRKGAAGEASENRAPKKRLKRVQRRSAKRHRAPKKRV
jgi:hypothetical protein